MTPQPAGHSRHTVENQDATPGLICSFGTTSGSSFSVACWQPAAAALAPVVATILKKSRRFMGSDLPSVVTGDAVERRVGAAFGVLVAVAVDAPAHRQRGRGRAKPDEVEQIVGDSRARARGVGGHGLDRAMTRLAFQLRAQVRLVRKI